MLLGIDHLVIACPDPDAAAAQLEDVVGLRASGGGRHETLGTFNRLVWLGDSYLELIGVFDRSLAERSWVGGPTCRTLDAGGGFVTWAVASDGISAEVARLRGAGSAISEPLAGERRRSDGEVVRWQLATPTRLAPDEPPFLIEHQAGSAEWTAADRLARAAARHPLGGPVRLSGLEVTVADPGGSGLRALRSVGIGPFRPSLAGAGAREAPVGGQFVRYARVRAPAGGLPVPVATIHLAVLGSAQAAQGSIASAEPGAVAVAIEALGCRFTVRQA